MYNYSNLDIRSHLRLRFMNSYYTLQHLERMEQNRIPKLLLNYKPRGRRDQGRPGRRWREQF
jgi:hypothetical protein